MAVNTVDVDRISSRAAFAANCYVLEMQRCGHVVSMDHALSLSIRGESVGSLNRLLSHSAMLREMYAALEHRFAGGASAELHKVFERHHREQAELADRIGARVLLGDHAVTITQEIAAPGAPAVAKGRASLAIELSRLLYAHEAVVVEAYTVAYLAYAYGDGPSDDLIGELIRMNQEQASRVGEHIVEVPLALAG